MTAEVLHDDPAFGQLVPILEREMGRPGPVIEVITRGLNETEAARRRTRVRALLADVAGIAP